MKSRLLRLRVVFSPVFTIMILLVMVMMACGKASNLIHTDSLGTLLMDEFGGIIWAEEISIYESVSWFMLFLPVGIAVAIFLHARMAVMLLLEGYRYRRTWRLYLQLMVEALLVVWTVVLLEVIVSVLVGIIGGLRGMAVWVTDGSGFIMLNHWLAYSAVVQFWLLASLITLFAFVLYLILRNITWFMIAFIFPSVLSVLSFSAPIYRNTYRLVNAGMAQRLSIEGSFGVPFSDAILRLFFYILVVAVLGGIIFCRIRKYDCRYE